MVVYMLFNKQHKITCSMCDENQLMYMDILFKSVSFK